MAKSPDELLADSLEAGMRAARVSGSRSSYRKDNPAEYAKVVAYLGGGARPGGTLTLMGDHLVLAEDARRALAVPTPVPPNPEPVPVAGDLFAAPNGDDGNPGTQGSPFKTLVKLQTSLAPGQVGMLRAGSYGSATTYHNLSKSGTAAGRIRVTNYPGERVSVLGLIEVSGNFVTIDNLHVDGSNAYSTDPGRCGTQALGLLLKGADILFERNEVFQTGLKGSAILQHGDRNIIRFNKLHDFGSCYAYDHGVYTNGAGVQIYGNWIWNGVHGWGIQVYPEPTNGRFYANVIDGCGSGFVVSDNGAKTCVGNDVYNNVILSSVGLTVQTGGRIPGAGLSGSGVVAGTNNRFRDNDCFGNPGGVGAAPNVSVSGNITVDPRLQGVAAHDYRPTLATPAAVQAYGLPTFVVGPSV